jgi:hypothetical protein
MACDSSRNLAACMSAFVCALMKAATVSCADEVLIAPLQLVSGVLSTQLGQP